MSERRTNLVAASCFSYFKANHFHGGMNMVSGSCLAIAAAALLLQLALVIAAQHGGLL